MPRSKSTYTSLEVNLEPGWLEVNPNPPPQSVSSPDPQHEKIQDHQDAGKIHYPKDNLPIRDPGEEKIAKYPLFEVVDLNRELPPLPVEASTVCGLRSWVFWTVVGAATIVLIAVVVGGSMGGVLYGRHDKSSHNTTAPIRVKSSPVLESSKMASLQYLDKTNVTHYRVYFQNQAGILRESTWDSNVKTWTVSDISDSSVDVQLGTPLACACGYPHAMKNHTFVCKFTPASVQFLTL